MFTDPTDGSTYVFPQNPNKMTSPYVQHSTTMMPYSPVDNRTRTWRTPQKPYEWQFAGNIRHKDFYDALVAWYVKNRRLHVTDHFGRTWDVQIVNVELTPQRCSRTVPWRYSYTVKTLMYGRLADVMIGTITQGGYNPSPSLTAGTTDSGVGSSSYALSGVQVYGYEAAVLAESPASAASVAASDSATLSNTVGVRPTASDSASATEATTLTATVTATGSGGTANDSTTLIGISGVDSGTADDSSGVVT